MHAYTSSLAIILRHSLMRRCRVLSWPSTKRSGYLYWSRFSRLFAVTSGSCCKVQRKNPRNAGMIGKRNRIQMSPMGTNNNASGSVVAVGYVIIECLSPTQHSSYEIIWRLKATGYIAAAVRKSSTHPDFYKR